MYNHPVKNYRPKSLQVRFKITYDRPMRQYTYTYIFSAYAAKFYYGKSSLGDMLTPCESTIYICLYMYTNVCMNVYLYMVESEASVCC